jgi:hypothetical protein
VELERLGEPAPCVVELLGRQAVGEGRMEVVRVGLAALVRRGLDSELVDEASLEGEEARVLLDVDEDDAFGP